MAEERYTRCPACKTVFRVTLQQLAIRAGQVRCGQCQTVFDGNAELVPVIPSNRRPEEAAQEDALGPATMTLRVPHAASVAPLAPSSVASYDQRFAWADRQRRRRRGATIAYGIGVPLLLLLLAGQAIYHFRDLIAARWPVAKPLLVRVCDVAGCNVEPVHDIAGLSIEASDLQADPAHRGLLVLTATLRNRSSWPLSYPYLELTLTDARDQPVARRALPPTEYAGGTAPLDSGIPANAEVPVKLFIDASATSQAGYRLYLFYP
ncbi:MAG TPA: DUF3426 domain-containing protein [Casimicrobiaceae bacterium]|nr:DUF3426 domain-containing protein [Casimicrobiaceae bacterium]